MSWSHPSDWFVAVIAVGYALASVVVLIWYREPQARRAVLQFEIRAGLPYDEERRADAVRRTLRRVSSGSAGMMLGCVAGVFPLVAFGGWAGLVLMAICSCLGFGIATWIVHRDELRERQTAVSARAASLDRRRLLDYLTPVEIGCQWLSIVAAVFAITVGVWALANHVWWSVAATALIVAGVLGAAGYAGGLLAQRWVVRSVQPAGTEAELRWEDAIRAQVLRELAALSGTTMMLVALSVSATIMTLADDERTGLLDAPVPFAAMLQYLWLFGVASGQRWGWKRLRRRWEPERVS